MNGWGVRLPYLVVLAAIAALVVQTTLFQVVQVSAVVPDLVLVLSVYLGLHRHSAGGSTAAFLIGYFNDSFSGNIVGLHAFSMTLVFLVVYFVSRRLWTDNILSNVTIVFVAAVLKGTSVAVLLAVFLPGDFPWGLFASTIWLEALVAALVSPIVFALLDGGRRVVGAD